MTTVSGKKSVSIDYNAKGKKVGKNILVTDKKGNIKSHKAYEKGKLSYKTVNTIKKGKIVKSMYYSYEKGKLTRTTKTTYSYSGNYTTEKTYESGVLEYESKYFTEKKTGRHVSVWTKSYYEGKLMSSMTFKAEKFTSGKQKGLVKQLNGYADGELVQKQVYSVKVL